MVTLLVHRLSHLRIYLIGLLYCYFAYNSYAIHVNNDTLVQPKKEQADTTPYHLPPHPDELVQERTAALDAPGETATAPEEVPMPPDSDNEQQDTASTTEEDALQAPIKYNAKDKIVFDLKHQTLHLYDTSMITYDNIKIEAEEVLLDWFHQTVTTRSKKNQQGEIVAKTVLTKDDVTYIAESICYNFQSQRAIAHKLFTKQDESIIRANTIKKDRATTFYADQAIYTTCDLAKPHFHVDVRRLKIIQDKQVASGSFNLHFDGVKTILGFPFGIFYLPQDTGIIPPKYGGHSEQGFCLENGGYFIKFNDYINLALKASLYTKGGTKFYADTQYKKRYYFDGDLHFEKQRLWTNTRADVWSSKRKIWRFKWNHKTEQNKYRSWNVQVDIEKDTEQKNVFSSDPDEQHKNSSSIRYTDHLAFLPLPYTLNGSVALHTKGSGYGHASLPELSLNGRNIYPFRKKGASGSSWYEYIYLQHTFAFKNKLTCKADDRLSFLKYEDWDAIGEKKKYGAIHTIPLQTNIKILRHLNLTPKITYRGRWYGEYFDYQYNTDGSIEQKSVPGSVVVQDFDFVTVLKTTLFGTHSFGRNTKVQAIQHKIRPELTLTYAPDFSEPQYGYWQTQKGVKRNRFKDAVYGSPDENGKAALAISLNNRLDIKTKGNPDKREGRSKKITLLESFDWSTQYDFLADTHAWDNIQLETRTNVFDKLIEVCFESTFDPYAYAYIPSNSKENQYVKSNELAWQHGKGIGHMNKANLSIHMKLKNTQSDEKDKPQTATVTLEQKKEEPTQYKVSKLPWALDVNYNWRYTCKKPGDTPKKTNSLSFEWAINFTEKWKVTCKSAYDLTNSKFIGDATKISVERDLHCWEMDFHWNPLGENQTYKFSIGLKAPLLKSIRYDRGEARYEKN